VFAPPSARKAVVKIPLAEPRQQILGENWDKYPDFNELDESEWAELALHNK
jgi:hypothetical protein